MLGVPRRRSAIFVGFLLASGAPAQTVESQRLFGTGDIMPGQSFAAYAAGLPAVGGQYVAFAAAGFAPDREVTGIYLYDGNGIQRVFDSTQGHLLPGSPTVNPADLLIEVNVNGDGRVVFLVEPYGVVSWYQGELEVVARTGAEPPDVPGGAFYSFAFSEIENDEMMVAAAIVDQQASRLYRWTVGGGLEPFSTIGTQGGVPVFENGSLTMFSAAPDGSNLGLWRNDGEGWYAYYPLTEPFPADPSQDWAGMGGGGALPAVLDAGVAVGGVSDDFSLAGLFRVGTGISEVVMLSGDPDPVSGIPSDLDPSVSASGDRISVRIHPEGPSALDVRLLVQESDRSFRSITARGETLGGALVGLVFQTQHALDGDRLAYWVHRHPDDISVWLADLSLSGPAPPNPLEIPAASAWSLLAIGLLLALVGAHRARRAR